MCCAGKQRPLSMLSCRSVSEMEPYSSITNLGSHLRIAADRETGLQCGWAAKALSLLIIL